MDWTTFKGAAKQLEDIDIPKVGALVGINEDRMHAIMDVEAGGDGFDSIGRPKMLRETHIFYRELAFSPGKQQLAVSQGLATTHWVRNYPKESYPDLRRMMAIDEMAALKSCSWGMGQIMGFNHLLAGYDTVSKMVEAFAEDEEHQLAGIVGFIERAGLSPAARAISSNPETCRAFGRGYNGEAYASQGYHTRIAGRYSWWSRVPDTPWSPGTGGDGEPIVVPRKTRLLRLTTPMMRGADVAVWQRNLKAVGYGPQVVDGFFGPQTDANTKNFQRVRNLTVDGKVGQETLAAMDAALAKIGVASKKGEVTAPVKKVDETTLVEPGAGSTPIEEVVVPVGRPPPATIEEKDDRKHKPGKVGMLVAIGGVLAAVALALSKCLGG